jgi:transcriptional regulator with XRE-family HTH domain
MSKNKDDLKNWFDREVAQLENDSEYIAYGLMTDLAAQVAHKLEKEGLRQKDLAEQLDKSQGWISRFMNDPTNFSVKKLVEIAVALDMKLDISFKEMDEMSSAKPKAEDENVQVNRETFERILSKVSDAPPEEYKVYFKRNGKTEHP